MLELKLVMVDVYVLDGTLIFFFHTVRRDDKVKFVIDFSGMGRDPFMRMRQSDRGFSSDLFHRIGAAALRSYDSAVGSLRSKLRRNGYAYEDDSHPVRLDVKYFTETNQALKTSILIYHSNLYGYCFRACGTWYCFDDSPYILLDRQGRQMARIESDASYEEDCFTAVGLSTITQSLRDLNNDNFMRHHAFWKRSVLHLCFCLIEAARFPEIYELVRISILHSFSSEESLYYRIPVDRYYWELVHSWGILSHSLRLYDSTGVWSMPQVNRDALKISGTPTEQINQARKMVSVRV